MAAGAVIPRVQVLGKSVRGASHVRAGLPNQDAFACLPKSGRGENVVAAVADGHGSGKSFRSDRGARLAVAIATRLLRSRVDELADAPVDGVHAQLEPFARTIVERWVEAVWDDIGLQPFEEDELGTLAHSARRELEANPLLAYGATVLATAVTGTGVYYLQLGDGDIVLVAQDGTAWTPLPPDQRLLANETTSLCLPNAWRDFRFGADRLEQAPRLVLLSTDGYSNSFQSQAAFLQVGSDLLALIEGRGLEAVGGNLKQWLQETTERGAGDDVTLAVVSVSMPLGYGRATAPPAPRPAAAAAPPTVSLQGPTAGARPSAGREGRPEPYSRPTRPAQPAVVGPVRRQNEQDAGWWRQPESQPAAGQRREVLLIGLGLVAIAVLWVLFSLVSGGGGQKQKTSPTTTSSIAVEPTIVGRPVPLEFQGLEWYLESDGALWVQDRNSGQAAELLDYGNGWQRLVVQDGALYLEADDRQQRVDVENALGGGTSGGTENQQATTTSRPGGTTSGPAPGAPEAHGR